MSSNNNIYIHSYSKKEQTRLIKQASILEPYIYSDINMDNIRYLLEVGCGVGAQTKILLKRFPHLKITAVDLSVEQLVQAEKYLAKEIKSGRVELILANAVDLSVLQKRRYDGAFLCWFLEHVPKPNAVMTEVKKYLRKNAEVWITEVNNAAFFMDPYSPNTLKYWFEFNDYQWAVSSNPFMGLKLGNILSATKYKDIKIDIKSEFYDSRDKKLRHQMIKYWQDLLLSAQGPLLKENRVTQANIDGMNKEFKALLKDPMGIIYSSWVRGRAING